MNPEPIEPEEISEDQPAAKNEGEEEENNNINTAFDTDLAGLMTVERGFYYLKFSVPKLEPGEVQPLLIPGGAVDMKILVRGTNEGFEFLVAGKEPKGAPGEDPTSEWWSPTSRPSKIFSYDEIHEIGVGYSGRGSTDIYHAGGSTTGAGNANLKGDQRSFSSVRQLGEIDEKALVNQINKTKRFDDVEISSISNFTGQIGVIQHVDMSKIDGLNYGTMLDYVKAEGDQVTGTILKQKDWEDLISQ